MNLAPSPTEPSPWVGWMRASSAKSTFEPTTASPSKAKVRPTAKSGVVPAIGLVVVPTMEKVVKPSPKPIGVAQATRGSRTSLVGTSPGTNGGGAG